MRGKLVLYSIKVRGNYINILIKMKGNFKEVYLISPFSLTTDLDDNDLLHILRKVFVID